jgi:DNA-binding NarL/FixJ family response regulator
VIRILIADDHPVVRAGIRALLDGEPDLEVVGEAAGADEAVALAAASGPDLVLMDLQFADGPRGVEATRRIRALPSAPHVLVLTNYDTDTDILSAIEAGASGYLLKDAPPDELVAAVRAAAAGESALAPVIASRLMERMRSPQVTLSVRELEVLELVAEGASNAEIGARLHIADATVKSHLVHIFTKLGVASRTAAVNAARSQGMLR